LPADSSSKKNIRKPDVTDHAIVKYFERVLGFDIEEVKKDILSEKFVKVWKICQGSHAKIPFMEGFKAVVQENMVVTIIGRKQKNNAKNRKRTTMVRANYGT